MAKKTAYGTSTGRQYLPAGAKRNPLTGTVTAGSWSGNFGQSNVRYYFKTGNEESGTGPVFFPDQRMQKWGSWSGGTFTARGDPRPEEDPIGAISFSLDKLAVPKKDPVKVPVKVPAKVPVKTPAKVPVKTPVKVAEEKINTEVTTLQSQLATAVAAIKNLQTSYNTKPEVTAPKWPGAPDWVQTFEDYRKWMRSKSAESGYISTIKTGSSGLLTDDYKQNVKVTALTAG